VVLLEDYFDFSGYPGSLEPIQPDMQLALTMRGWGIEDADPGIITDMALALEDLSALYRVEGGSTGVDAVEWTAVLERYG
jgi:hypothetical protein